MSNFNEWYEKVGVVQHYIYVNEKWIAKIGFEAGAASRQAEIDALQNELIKAAEGQMKLFEHNNELQKRIDDLLESIDWHIEDCDFWLVMNKNDSWKGGQREILRAIKNKLKGEQND